jgi:SAM-dependent methyltransferase
LSNGVLHHTPNLDASLREIHRVLRPGGEARIILYNRHSLHYWLGQVFWEELVRGGLRREQSMLGVLSAGVERSSVGARPLVRVYSARDVRVALYRVGFGTVRTLARHFHWEDIPHATLLGRAPALRSEAMQARIGRVAGWYVIGIGLKP